MKNKNHQLKCWPDNFAAMRKGLKKFDIRKNDRNYKVGDILIMREWIPLSGYIGAAQGDYTGRKLKFKVTFIMDGSTDFNCTSRPPENGLSWGLVKRFVCMQLQRMK